MEALLPSEELTMTNPIEGKRFYKIMKRNISKTRTIYISIESTMQQNFSGMLLL